VAGSNGIAFVTGPWSQAIAQVLAVGTLLYAVACAFHVRRAFRARLEDRWSALGTTLTLLGLAVALLLWGPAVLPTPFGATLLIPLVGGVLFTLLFTALRLQRLVERLKQALPLPAAPEMDHETRRKTPHLLMGLNLLVYAGGGHLWLSGLAWLDGLLAPPVPHNLAAAADAPWLSGGHAVALWLLLAILYLLLPVELVRLRFPDAEYPWKRIILTRLRSREAGLMGAHIHMSAALCLCLLLLTRDPGGWGTAVPACLAVLSVTVFADAASALVGRRWGRRKWFHNPNKSYLGSAGGTVVAVLVALPFVGVAGAVAAAAVFLAMDILGPIPLPVSDNLLNPLGLAALFLAAPGLARPLLPYY
jgi:dolichol kinase